MSGFFLSAYKDWRGKETVTYLWKIYFMVMSVWVGNAFVTGAEQLLYSIDDGWVDRNLLLFCGSLVLSMYDSSHMSCFSQSKLLLSCICSSRHAQMLPLVVSELGNTRNGRWGFFWVLSLGVSQSPVVLRDIGMSALYGWPQNSGRDPSLFCLVWSGSIEVGIEGILNG